MKKRSGTIKKGDICLLMTGCIAPSIGVYTLAVRECGVRKEQYVDAFKFYIEHTNIKKIVYCDNSNAKEIEGIKKKAEENGKEFEWLSFQGNSQKTIENGKGYGEGEILKYAYTNSKIIPTCKYVIKVTGRLKVKNIDLILKMIRNDNNYINIFINSQGKPYADTRFFITKIIDFNKNLINEFEKVNDKQGEFLEICYGKKIVDSKMQFKRMPVYIGYEGISGSTGLRYLLTFKEKVHISKKILNRMILCKDEIYDSMALLSIGLILDSDIWNRKFATLTDKNVAIYGAGIWGERFYKLGVKNCDIVIWADKKYKNIKKKCGKRIRSPQEIKDCQIDYIIIAINNANDARRVSEMLKGYGIEADILWFNGYDVELCR